MSPQILRQLFNALAIAEKARDGYFTTRLIWQGRRIPQHLALGSISQMWEYVNREGRPFAKAHQYRDPSNRPIGLPDPKYLRIDDVILFAHATYLAG